MTAEVFLQRIDELAEQSNWQGILDLCDAHYDEVEPQLSEEERLAITGGTLRTAYGIIEARKRGLAGTSTSHQPLARAA